ncbi:MAG TPA: hypothetical protein VJG32_10395 [Anaerolineae bacterium]|nr:hypothetical protein [Anaerolineae bacterium]
MQTRLKLKPGQPGTKKQVAEYGDKLVCVRYRYDVQKKKRYKTVELIIEEVDWQPQLKPLPADTLLLVKVKWGELELARQVKQAGGKWNADVRAWELRYDRVVQLRLEERVIGGI